MKQTLEALWNGQIAPGPACGVHDPEMEHLAVLLDRNQAQLNQELTEAQRERFAKYVDCANEFTYHSSLRAFCDGFSLASKLWMEALSET